MAKREETMLTSNEGNVNSDTSHSVYLAKKEKKAKKTKCEHECEAKQQVHTACQFTSLQ